MLSYHHKITCPKLDFYFNICEMPVILMMVDPMPICLVSLACGCVSDQALLLAWSCKQSSFKFSRFHLYSIFKVWVLYRSNCSIDFDLLIYVHSSVENIMSQLISILQKDGLAIFN